MLFSVKERAGMCLYIDVSGRLLASEKKKMRGQRGMEANFVLINSRVWFGFETGSYSAVLVGLELAV